MKRPTVENGEKREKRKKNSVMVTTKISAQTRKEIKDLGLKINHVIELGLRAYKDNPQLINRVRETEFEIKQLRETVTRLSRKMYELEEKQK